MPSRVVDMPAGRADGSPEMAFERLTEGRDVILLVEKHVVSTQHVAACTLLQHVFARVAYSCLTREFANREWPDLLVII